METVGEALAQLARTDPAAPSQISEYQRIVAFRNILIHGYAEIDHRIVWNVLELKLPVVRRQAEALLSAGERSGGDRRRSGGVSACADVGGMGFDTVDTVGRCKDAGCLRSHLADCAKCHREICGH